MSDLSDIYSALMSARHAVGALATWVNTVGARDTVQSHSQSIERGIAAYERLARDLKDGRKHVEPPADYERTSCGCGDPDASPPCSYCETPSDEDGAA